VWAGDQSRSAKSRLSRELKCLTTTAGRELRRARTLARVPATVEAIAAGELSMDHVDVMGPAEAADPAQFAADERVLVVQYATLALFFQARRRRGVLATARRPRRFRHRSRGRGRLVVACLRDDRRHRCRQRHPGPDRRGKIYTDELNRLAELLRLADGRNGVVRTASQRRAAAQVEMARRSAAMPADAKLLRPLFTALVGDAPSPTCAS